MPNQSVVFEPGNFENLSIVDLTGRVVLIKKERAFILKSVYCSHMHAIYDTQTNCKGKFLRLHEHQFKNVTN